MNKKNAVDIDSIETISLRSISISSNESEKKPPIVAFKKKKIKRVREKKKSLARSPQISDVLKYLSFINKNN